MKKKRYQPKPIEDMDLDEMVDYWTGQLVLGLGKGDVRTTVSIMLQITFTVAATWAKKEKKTK